MRPPPARSTTGLLALAAEPIARDTGPRPSKPTPTVPDSPGDRP